MLERFTNLAHEEIGSEIAATSKVIITAHALHCTDGTDGENFAATHTPQHSAAVAAREAKTGREVAKKLVTDTSGECWPQCLHDEHKFGL